MGVATRYVHRGSMCYPLCYHMPIVPNAPSIYNVTCAPAFTKGQYMHLQQLATPLSNNDNCLVINTQQELDLRDMRDLCDL